MRNTSKLIGNNILHYMVICNIQLQEEKFTAIGFVSQSHFHFYMLLQLLLCYSENTVQNLYTVMYLKLVQMYYHKVANQLID